MEDDLVTISNGYRVTTINNPTSATSVRLRSELFKGGLTAVASLPQNRLLVLGSDGGTIRLME